MLYAGPERTGVHLEQPDSQGNIRVMVPHDDAHIKALVPEGLPAAIELSDSSASITSESVIRKPGNVAQALGLTPPDFDRAAKFIPEEVVAGSAVEAGYVLGVKEHKAKAHATLKQKLGGKPPSTAP